MVDYQKLLSECDQDIRSGQVGRAAKKLNQLNTAQVPREWRLSLAKVCRRAGLVTISLKLLTPLVLAGQRRLEIAPTPEELAEYAVNLQRNGSVKEALNILAGVPKAEVPDALLFTAFCHFNRWDYKESIAPLESYLLSSAPNYWKLVGRVNLSAALAMTRQHERALEILGLALEQARSEKQVRIEANCLELCAQVHLQMDHLALAEKDLERAAKLFENSQTHDHFFITKWQRIIAARKTGSTEPLLLLRSEANERRLWETAREADLQALRIRFEHPLYERLIFGTPFAAFRERVQRETGLTAIATHTTVGAANSPCLDISQGTVDDVQKLKPGSKTHQLMEILLRDFYRPASIGGLFAELFPGEYFNIFSSPDRVHQILLRSRVWLKRSGIPVQIVEKRRTYALETSGPFAFRIPLMRTHANWYEVHMQTILRRFSDNRKISVSDIRETLDFTEAEYKRFLKWALEQNRLCRVGGGRATAYQLPSASPLKAA